MNKYISTISDLYNQEENMSLESKKKHDIMFSDPELDSIFSHFILNYVPGLYLYFFLYMVINPLL